MKHLNRCQNGPLLENEKKINDPPGIAIKMEKTAR